jgi:hypothetical protein
MRIGIVIFKDDPQIGRGLTYVQEILEGLNRQLTKSEHRTLILIISTLTGYEKDFATFLHL